MRFFLDPLQKILVSIADWPRDNARHRITMDAFHSCNEFFYIFFLCFSYNRIFLLILYFLVPPVRAFDGERVCARDKSAFDEKAGYLSSFFSVLCSHVDGYEHFTSPLFSLPKGKNQLYFRIPLYLS